MKNEYFILEGETPKPVDMMTWAKWFETADRVIASDRIGKISISTIFLGLNHNFRENQSPLIFETMVFGGDFDGEMLRYSTFADAESGHLQILEKVKASETILDASLIF